jgi:protein-tyrosine phosphatase
VESIEPPRYDKQSALTAGWTIYSIPIKEGAAPSLEQICDFMNLLKTLPDETKVLVFCESGQGRTAFMGAAYWINKGLSASDAIVRMSEACATSDSLTPERQQVLVEYERSIKG